MRIFYPPIIRQLPIYLKNKRMRASHALLVTLLPISLLLGWFSWSGLAWLNGQEGSYEDFIITVDGCIRNEDIRTSEEWANDGDMVQQLMMPPEPRINIKVSPPTNPNYTFIHLPASLVSDESPFFSDCETFSISAINKYGEVAIEASDAPPDPRAVIPSLNDEQTEAFYESLPLRSPLDSIVSSVVDGGTSFEWSTTQKYKKGIILKVKTRDILHEYAYGKYVLNLYVTTNSIVFGYVMELPYKINIPDSMKFNRVSNDLSTDVIISPPVSMLYSQPSFWSSLNRYDPKINYKEAAYIEGASWKYLVSDRDVDSKIQSMTIFYSVGIGVAASLLVECIIIMMLLVIVGGKKADKVVADID